MRAPVNSTFRFVPGMVLASQRAHFDVEIDIVGAPDDQRRRLESLQPVSIAKVCLLSKAARKRSKSSSRASLFTSGRR